MKLKDLISKLNYEEIINEENIEITGLSYNSKTVKAGDIFICLKGEHSDGHQWAQSAFEKGVRVFFCEQKLPLNATQIIVKSTRLQIADLAAAFYNYPSKDINLIGVTGTNGKTTVTHLLQKIFEEAKQQCALIGTLGYKTSSKEDYKEAVHTTPQAPELQAVINRIKSNEINNIVMEVSSHSLVQNRVGACYFNGAIFTNLTQDHLDYHITMENYFLAKALLFKKLSKDNFAVINIDDNYAEKFINLINKDVKIITYSTKNINADLFANNISYSPSGVSFDCKYLNNLYSIKLKSNGIFSVYNALAAIGGSLCNNISFLTCKKALEETEGVSGRFETVVKEPLIIVDYAHTPDGLENVLKAARTLTPKDASLICLFGCGGDRDATKRPKMGRIADILADKIIVTSDNPRSEDPDLIISDIMTGINSIDTKRIFVEPDREAAIKFVKKIATNKDVVVIAGKGHENYQILKDKTIHFDDKEEVLKNFSKIVL